VCARQSSAVEKIAAEFEGRLVVGAVNVDRHKALTKRFDVGMYPTFILFKDGRQIDRFKGLKTADYLRDKINGALGAEDGRAVEKEDK
jgi:thioredoxin 1